MNKIDLLYNKIFSTKFIYKYIALVVSVFFILFFRVYDLFKNDFIAWEDGTVFLTNAINYPWWKSLFMPYAGYLHLGPNLVAEIMSGFPLEEIPRIYIISGISISTLALSTPFFAFKYRIPSDSARFIFVLISAFVPWPFETLGNITCIQWYLLYALSILIIGDSEHYTPFISVLILLFSILTIFSCPTTVILIPLILLKLIVEKSKLSRFVFMCIGLCITVMMVVTYLNMDHSTLPPKSDLSITDRFFYVIIGLGAKAFILPIAGLISVLFLEENLKNKTSLLNISIYVSSLVCYFTLYLKMFFSKKWNFKKAFIPLGLLYITLAQISMVALLRDHPVSHLIKDNRILGHDRYFLLPALFTILMITLFFIDFWTRNKSWWCRVPIVLLSITWLCWSSLPYLKISLPKDVLWRDQVQTYRKAIQNTASSKEEGEEKFYYLSVFPGGQDWRVQLPLY